MQCGGEEKRQGRKRVAGEENMVGKEGWKCIFVLHHPGSWGFMAHGASRN